jgi:predicted glycoside hydrolase/deacetylase ChbG (UPF0249 family)
VRILVVNADDFGQTAGITRGIVTAYEQGIVTSASLMVRWPEAVHAAAYGRDHSALSLGLHLDLGEWVYRDGTWVPWYQVVPPDDAEAIRREVAHQVSTFRRLVGRNPTHLDSHQHVHRDEPTRSVVLDTARRLGVPLRGAADTIAYCGAFYGQCSDGTPLPEAITVDALAAVLRSLPPGVTELACHPADSADAPTGYRAERMIELAILCDDRIRRVIDAERIQLRPFHALDP